MCAARSADGQVYSNNVSRGVKSFSGASAALGSNTLSAFRVYSTQITGERTMSSTGLLRAGRGRSDYSTTGTSAGVRRRTTGRRIDRKVGTARRGMRRHGAQTLSSGVGHSTVIARNRQLPFYGGGGAGTPGDVRGQTGYTGRLGQQRLALLSYLSDVRRPFTLRQSLRSKQTLSSAGGLSNLRSLREQGR